MSLKTVLVNGRCGLQLVERNVRTERKTGKSFIFLDGRRILVVPDESTPDLFRVAGQYTF